jgi:hypothetical protein
MEGKSRQGLSRVSCPSQLKLFFSEASRNRDTQDTQDRKATADRFYIPFILSIPVKFAFQRNVNEQGYTGYTGLKGKSRQGLHPVHPVHPS